MERTTACMAAASSRSNALVAVRLPMAFSNFVLYSYVLTGDTAIWGGRCATIFGM